MKQKSNMLKETKGVEKKERGGMKDVNLGGLVIRSVCSGQWPAVCSHLLFFFFFHLKV